MSVTPGKGSVHPSIPDVEELLRRYAVLLDLYTELESVSEDIFSAIESGSSPPFIRESLDLKMAVADRIVGESRAIAGMKKMLIEEGALESRDRKRVRHCEENLTRMVGRVVEQENKGRDLIMNRGIRIARR